MSKGRGLVGATMVVIAACWAFIPALSASAANQPFNAVGTWNCCGAGGASAQIWVMNGTTGVGHTTGGAEFATISASYNYPLVQITTTYTNSTYVATFNGTITPDNNTISGAWSSNQNQHGTFTATREGTVTTVKGVKVAIAVASPHLGVGRSTSATVTVTAAAQNLTNVTVGLSAVNHVGSLTIVPPANEPPSFDVAAFGSISVVYELNGIGAGTDPLAATVSATSASGTLNSSATSSIDVVAASVSSSSYRANVAPIARTLGTPNEIFHSLRHNLINAGVTVGVILFITFPATIFNSTFSANYGEILLILERWRRRLRRLVGLKDERPSSADLTHVDPSSKVTPTIDAPGRASRPWFYAVLACGAILGGLLNPKFGLNGVSASSFGATLLAFGLGAGISFYIAKIFRKHHHYPSHTYLRALPLGLGVAATCVLVSRLSSFEPGYLYGVVVSIAFVESLEDRHNAHLTAISSLSTLAVAVLAWFAWVPINHLTLTHAGIVPLAIVDDVLGSIFVGGLVGTVVGLLPLQFMPGGTLAKWRKDVWAVVFFIALFLLIEVEMRPASGPTHPGHAPVVTAIALFVIFGGATFWMRRYFATHPATATAHLPPPPPPPPALIVQSDVSES